MEFIFVNFWKNFKNEDFGLFFLKKGHILMPFSGLALSKLKIWVIGGVHNAPMPYGSGKCNYKETARDCLRDRKSA